MSTSKSLTSRPDVENSDIPEIIEKAERLRQQALSERERESYRSSVQDVKLVGRDLSIPDQFVEQAIAELNKERQEKIKHEQKELHERKAMQTEIRTGLSRITRVVGAIVGLVLLIRGSQWLWFALDFTPDEPPPPDVVIEERIIKETVLKTVKTVVEEPAVRAVVKKVEVKELKSKRKISKSKTAVPKDRPNPVATVVETPVIKKAQPESASSEKSGYSAKVNAAVEPTLKVVEPKVQIPIEDPEKSLPHLTKQVEGEWVLDAYLLYEKGVELPMEVPVVYEPLELPKTWRFTSGKYKRVMDTNLSFTARFEVTSLPDSLRPVADEKGEWGQLVASNVVSTIPGIRRQNDYFAVLVANDMLTIWYLGPNAYRKKLPSQAERYVRK